MKYLVRFLRIRGMQRGVLGSSRGWLGVWVAITLAQQINKRLGKEPELVGRVVLRPGQGVEVRDTAVRWADDPLAPPKGRRSRRQARKAGQAR
jgi:hypothetical protein